MHEQLKISIYLNWFLCRPVSGKKGIIRFSLIYLFEYQSFSRMVGLRWPSGLERQFSL